ESAGEGVGIERDNVGQEAGNKDVGLLIVEVTHFNACVLVEVQSVGEVNKLIVVCRRHARAIAGSVVLRGLKVISEAEAPVRVAAQDGLLPLPGLAVGVVTKSGAAVRFKAAVLEARRRHRLDVQERKARSIANAVGAFDDEHAENIVGAQLADDGVKVNAS